MERRRIAHALHDETGQLLTAIHLKLARVAREAPPEFHASLEEIRALLDGMEMQLRRLSHELRPIILDDLGLVPAVEFLIEGVKERTGISIRFRASVERRLPPAIEAAAYRIVQEALTNVGRHSRASEAVVQLHEDGRALRCAVRDNGAGFQVGGRPGAGLGLHGIRSRAEGLGGRVSIQSSAGGGTEIVAIIPTV
jgi:signal transduction histidine kinase